MQAQVKYESEIKTAVLGDRTITVKNVTPIYSPQERDKRNREIERRLFVRKVRRTEGVGRSHPCCMGALEV